MARHDSQRRDVLGGLAGAVALACWPGIAIATVPSLTRTARMTAGPFYPRQKPLDHDADLVRSGNRIAKGEWLDLRGRIVDLRDRPVAKARVEIWQCDVNGAYHHPADPGLAPRDEGFQGFGETVTASDGSYRFRTIRPVPYQSRTAHIHFRVSGPGIEPLTTQMFVAGDPANGSDRLYNGIRDRRLRDALTVVLEPIASTEAKLAARFDLVLVADGRLGLL